MVSLASEFCSDSQCYDCDDDSQCDDEGVLSPPLAIAAAARRSPEDALRLVELVQTNPSVCAFFPKAVERFKISLFFPFYFFQEHRTVEKHTVFPRHPGGRGSVDDRSGGVACRVQTGASIRKSSFLNEVSLEVSCPAIDLATIESVLKRAATRKV